MLRVALTGGIATGKSYCLERFAAHGVPVIDADVLAREAVAPGTPGLAAIAARFGPAVIAADGTLDRAIGANRAAADAECRILARAIHASEPEKAARIETGVSAFVKHAIGKMMTICRTIRHARATISL